MILQRYVLKEHLGPFLFSFSVIMFLLVVDLILQMIDLLLGKGVGLSVVLELFFLNTAWMVALAVPMAVLVGTLMAFGRLSADSEVAAMRALGIGVHQVAWPVLAAGLVLAGLLVEFNDRVLPEFNYRARVLTSDIQRKRPAVVLKGRTGIFIEDFDHFRILIGSIDPVTSRLKDILIYKYGRDDYPVTIVAREGEVHFSRATDEAILTLYHGQVHRVDDTDPRVYVRAKFEKQVLRLGKAGHRLERTISRYRTDREMSVEMMMARVSKSRSELKKAREQASGRVARFFRQVLLEDPRSRGPSARLSVAGLVAQADADAQMVVYRRHEADRYLVEIHKKFSIPAACLVFVLVGVPLGVRARGSSPAVGAGISIGFFLLYWMCLIAGEKLADRGLVAPWFAMWSPNIFIGLAGGWLSFRMTRERRIWRR